MLSKNTEAGQEKIVMTTCSSHCGGTCILRVHVRDGVIARIETDDGEEPQFRACLKGRAYRQRVYGADRLKYPMKRVGKRGEGRFERISWDEALDTVARELIRVKQTYGNAAIFFKGSGGDQAAVHGQAVIGRLLSMFGGYPTNWGYYSYEGGVFAELSTYGTLMSRNTRDNFLDSKLILMWGFNPVDSISDTGTAWFLAQAKERGARIVAIDPRFSRSAATFAHQVVRPGREWGGPGGLRQRPHPRRKLPWRRVLHEYDVSPSGESEILGRRPNSKSGRCIGCALCVSECALDAISLEARPKDEVTVPPTHFQELMTVIAREKQRTYFYKP